MKQYLSAILFLLVAISFNAFADCGSSHSSSIDGHQHSDDVSSNSESKSEENHSEDSSTSSDGSDEDDSSSKNDSKSFSLAASISSPSLWRVCMPRSLNIATWRSINDVALPLLCGKDISAKIVGLR